jgi:antitoxin component YwqK of YwqJK toxin-antitoxin module
MSYIKGEHPGKWIEENMPENGLFRVYWKDLTGDIEYDNDNAGVTFDSEEGEGLRYEWYYKDGERADGESKGWFSNGISRSIYTYKNKKADGLWTEWFPNGNKRKEGYHRDGKQHGIWRHWNSCGVLIAEEKFNDGILVHKKHYNEQGEEFLDSKWEPGI